MPDVISVKCTHCDSSLKLKDKSAIGKKAKCPKCGELFVVSPAEDDLEVVDDLDDFGDLGESEADEIDDDQDEADDDDDDSPRRRRSSGGRASKPAKGKKKKKKKSTNMLVPLLLIGGGIVLLGLIVAGVMFLPGLLGGGGSNKIDLTYTLPGSNFIVEAKVSEIWNAPILSPVTSLPDVQQGIGMATAQIGIGPADVTRVLITMKVPNEQNQLALQNPAAIGPQLQPVAVIYTSKPVNLAGLSTLGGVSATHGGKNYTSVSMPGQQPVGFYQPETQILVIAFESDLKTIIERGKKQERRRDLDFIDPSFQFSTIALGDGKTQPNIPPNLPPQLRSFIEATVSMTGAQTGLTLTSGAHLHMRMNMTDSTGATRIKGEVDNGIALLKSQWEAVKPQVPAFFKELADLADATLSSLETTQDGQLVTANLRLPETAKDVFAKIPQMIAGAAMFGGGNPFGDLFGPGMFGPGGGGDGAPPFGPGSGGPPGFGPQPGPMGPGPGPMGPGPGPMGPGGFPPMHRRGEVDLLRRQAG